MQETNRRYYRSSIPEPYVVGFGREVGGASNTGKIEPFTMSFVRNSTGNYTITHNLGNKFYLFLATIIDGNQIKHTVNDNNIVVQTFNNNTLTDSKFSFIIYSTN